MSTHEALTADRIREIFSTQPFDEAAVDRAVAYYADDVVFVDPIQTLHGRAAFVEMNKRLLGRVRELRFDVDAVTVDAENVFLAWRMHARIRSNARRRSGAGGIEVVRGKSRRAGTASARSAAAGASRHAYPDPAATCPEFGGCSHERRSGAETRTDDRPSRTARHRGRGCSYHGRPEPRPAPTGRPRHSPSTASRCRQPTTRGPLPVDPIRR
jgi:ketosteroid isomerase-like protein